MRFYNIQTLWEKGCDYNFVISGRGPGKSTAMVNKLIDLFAQDGQEFVRVARYDWEVSRVLMGQWFNEVNRERLHDKLGCTVGFEGGRWVLRDEADDKLTQVMGHLCTLNNQDTFKSAAYDRVTNIVFEEFSMLSDRDYMVGEVPAFLSLVSTIVRRRQGVRVWFIGNTLSKHNPYFDFFGIDVDRMGIKPGQIRTFRCAGFGGHGATVAVEFVEMAEDDYMELSPLMRIGGNVTATSGLYEIDPSVTDFERRVAAVPTGGGWRNFVSNVQGVYMGNGEFAHVMVTRRPVFDDLRLLAVSRARPNPDEMFGGKPWLNLSGEFNPTLEFEEGLVVLRPVPCVSPLTLYSEETLMHRFQATDARCVHAYETDDFRYKWRNFVDMWNYEKGAV